MIDKLQSVHVDNSVTQNIINTLVDALGKESNGELIAMSSFEAALDMYESLYPCPLFVPL